MENCIHTSFVLLSSDDNNWTCNHSFEELQEISEADLKFKLTIFDDEVWKSGDVAGFSRYHVSNYGRIKRLKEKQTKRTGINDTLYAYTIPEKILTGHLAEDGYIYITMKDDSNNNANIAIHRLVAFLFCPENRPEKLKYTTKEKKVVDHINRTRNDNRAVNLRWASYSENGKNSIRNANKKYDYKNPLIDFNAKESDLISDVIPNVSARWFTKVNFKDEVWKIVRDYEEYNVYVSNYGRILKPIYNSEETFIAYYYDCKGYFHVTLPQRPFENCQQLFRVHQLVAQEFLDYTIGSTDESGKRLVIDHMDADKHNNSACNLRVCSQKDNMRNENTYKLFLRRRNSSALSYRINAYEYPSGDFVQQFDNCKLVSDYYDISYNTALKVCKGKEAFAYSKKYNKHYIFRVCDLSYIDDRTNLWNSDVFNKYDLYNDKKSLFTKNKRERIFNVYDYPSGNFIKQYDNFKDACDDFKLTISSIANALVGKTLLAFSKKDKKCYILRRTNSDNMNNFSNIFETDMLNIGDRIITKEDINKSYNPHYDQFINLYSYPSGRFVSQFNFVEDVVKYFNNRIKSYTIYECLSNERRIVDKETQLYYILKFVKREDKDSSYMKNIDGIILKKELDLMINQKVDDIIIHTYNNILEIKENGQEFDIDSIFYHLQTDRTLYGYEWCYTRKHKEDININATKLNSKRRIISVNKYTLDGKYISHYNDLYDITSDETKMYNIKSCVDEKVQSAYGYIWKNSDKYPENVNLDIKPVKCQFLYFSAYDENDNLIESFKSTKVAAQKYDIVVRKIYRMIDKEVFIEYEGKKIKFKKDEYNGLE